MNCSQRTQICKSSQCELSCEVDVFVSMRHGFSHSCQSRFHYFSSLFHHTNALKGSRKRMQFEWECIPNWSLTCGFWQINECEEIDPSSGCWFS